MTIAYDEQEREWSAQSEQNPFAESMPEARAEPESAATTSQALASWNESLNPFSETPGEAMPESEADRLLHRRSPNCATKTFDEAIAFLAEETEQAVADRFTDESPYVGRRTRALCRRPTVRGQFEAQQYLDALEAGLTGKDIESLTEEQLDEVLDRLDPQPGELTPAGEEFIGALVRKAKKVVKFVANTAKTSARPWQGRRRGARAGAAEAARADQPPAQARAVLRHRPAAGPAATRRAHAGGEASRPKRKTKDSLDEGADVARQPDRCRSAGRIVRRRAGRSHDR